VGALVAGFGWDNVFDAPIATKAASDAWIRYFSAGIEMRKRK